MDMNKQIIIRQTYGVLDYFGDIGGLIDGLYYLIAFICSPFWKYNYASHMLTKLFKDGADRKAPEGK